jgi:hypothetical protein
MLKHLGTAWGCSGRRGGGSGRMSSSQKGKTAKMAVEGEDARMAGVTQAWGWLSMAVAQAVVRKAYTGVWGRSVERQRGGDS